MRELKSVFLDADACVQTEPATARWATAVWGVVSKHKDFHVQQVLQIARLRTRPQESLVRYVLHYPSMPGDRTRDSACASACVLHLGGGKTLLVRHCVRVVTISISFDIRLALGAAAAAASPLVPLRPPIAAAVAHAPAQASFTLRLATPAACAGQSESTPHNNSQSSNNINPEPGPGFQARTCGALPNKWAASLEGLLSSAELAHSMCTAGLKPWGSNHAETRKRQVIRRGRKQHVARQGGQQPACHAEINKQVRTCVWAHHSERLQRRSWSSWWSRSSSLSWCDM